MTYLLIVSKVLSYNNNNKATAQFTRYFSLLSRGSQEANSLVHTTERRTQPILTICYRLQSFHYPSRRRFALDCCRPLDAPAPVRTAAPLPRNPPELTFPQRDPSELSLSKRYLSKPLFLRRNLSVFLSRCYI